MSDKIAPEKTNTPPEKLENGECLPLVWERILCLIIAALLGLLFAKNGGSLLRDMGWANESLAESIQLEILFLSLPVLYVLWLFRTWDTQKSIEAAKQSVEAAKQSEKTTRESVETTKKNVETAQQSLNANTLARGIDMLSSDNLRTRILGLIQLAKIKRQGNFIDEIDVATRQGIDLRGALMEGEDLSGLNLDGALLGKTKFYEVDLSGASLRFARFEEAVLSNTKLIGANLRFANFNGADLMGADLSKAQLQKAKLKEAQEIGNIKSLNDAEYDRNTKFPDWFDPKKKGMIYKEDPILRP